MPTCHQESEKNNLFPVFFKLENLQTLVVGGGNVGLEKLTALLSNAPKAPVTLVGKKVHPEIRRLAGSHSTVTVIERVFSPSDLYQKDLVLIATDRPEINLRIRQQAKAMRILVNVADTPELCDFYLGSIVQKGNLKLAISTNGKSPTLAKRLREVLTEALPEGLEETLRNLKQIRDSLKGDFNYKVKKLNEITSVLKSPKRESTLTNQT